MNVMSRANSLAFYELLGNAQLMNDELQRYQEITAADIRAYSQQLFAHTNSNVLHYLRKNKS
jgi:predicted Zn-dependent peptidase